MKKILLSLAVVAIMGFAVNNSAWAQVYGGTRINIQYAPSVETSEDRAVINYIDERGEPQTASGSVILKWSDNNDSEALDKGDTLDFTVIITDG